jgi:hypothetical protein
LSPQIETMSQGRIGIVIQTHPLGRHEYEGLE